MSIVRQRISFKHQAPIRKTNVFSTCFYISFLSRDFLSFCLDSLYTCSYSHLPLHTRHLFAEIAYQITQLPRVFDTQFLPFYTTCKIQCTCQKPNKPAVGVGVGVGSSFFLILVGFLAFLFFIFGFLSDRSEGSVLTTVDKTTMLKLQVCLT